MSVSDPEHSAQIRKHLDSGRSYHRQGQFPQALECYRAALELDQRQADALYYSGLTRYRMGDTEIAISLIEQAISSNPDSGAPYGSLGQIKQDLQQHHEAVSCFRQATERMPGNATACNGMGVSLKFLGHNDEAADAFHRAILLDERFLEPRINLANLHRALGRLDLAKDEYRQCLVIAPDSPEANNNLGALYHQRQQQDKAAACFEKAIQSNPDYGEALNNLGTIYREQGKAARAQHCFDLAMQRNPDSLASMINAGMTHLQAGQHQPARELFDRALTLQPENLAAKWARCIAGLDPIYLSLTDIHAARSRYADCLQALVDAVDLNNPEVRKEVRSLVGMLQPFQLAYQGYNDRELQALYGELVCNAMEANSADSSDNVRNGPVRVGIVSAFFYDHSNWKMPIQGWLPALSEEFELMVFHTGHKTDAITVEVRDRANRFYQGLSATEFADQIVECGIDVLIYPEVGMHPVTTQLATRRLAPIQCASWGHPVSTGFPTIDYYLSSVLMEPENAVAHYSEELVLLPGLSSCYPAATEVAGPGFSRQDFGFGPTDIVYLCVQNLSKYLPQYDQLLLNIVKNIGHARLVFIKGPEGATALLSRRLEQQFTAQGLDYHKHVVWLERLPKDKYQSLCRIADVFLDTPMWSGCNSTLEALAVNLPVVTLPGDTMRSRHSAAIYRLMNVYSMIANDEAGYVDLAVRLGTDPEWNRQQRGLIAGNMQMLYADNRPAQALVSFIKMAVKNKNRNGGAR